MTADKAEFEQLNDKYQRALADYQNLLKQTAKDKVDFTRYANESLVREFIPIYDHLKMSLAYADKTDDKWLTGVKLVVEQFKKVLLSAGVKEIEAVGLAFDHQTMEAIGSEETTDVAQDGLVAKQVQNGYSLHDKIIIPARVIAYKLVE